MPVYTNKENGRLYVQFNHDHKQYKKYLPAGSTVEFGKEYELKWRTQIIQDRISRGIETSFDENQQVSHRSTRGIVYVLKCGVLYKIGMTRNLTRRLRGLRTALASPVELLYTLEVLNARLVERYLHKLFAAQRKQGEWFELRADDVEFLRAISTAKRVPLLKKSSKEGLSEPLWRC